MDILSRGKPAPPRPPYWAGTRVSCPCGFSAILQAGDKVRTENEKCPNGKRVIIVACPDCGKNIRQERRGGGLDTWGTPEAGRELIDGKQIPPDRE